MHPKFILGFIAGEGSFGLKVQKESRGDAPVSIAPAFEINVNGRERTTLEQISDELPLESQIYDIETADLNGGEAAKLYIGGYTKLDPLFTWIEEHADDGFRSSDKYDSYQKLVEVVELMKDGEHLTEDGILRIMEIRDTMNGAGHVNKTSKADVQEMIEN